MGANQSVKLDGSATKNNTNNKLKTSGQNHNNKSPSGHRKANAINSKQNNNNLSTNEPFNEMLVDSGKNKTSKSKKNKTSKQQINHHQPNDVITTTTTTTSECDDDDDAFGFGPYNNNNIKNHHKQQCQLNSSMKHNDNNNFAIDYNHNNRGDHYYCATTTTASLKRAPNNDGVDRRQCNNNNNAAAAAEIMTKSRGNVYVEPPTNESDIMYNNRSMATSDINLANYYLNNSSSAASANPSEAHSRDHHRRHNRQAPQVVVGYEPEQTKITQFQKQTHHRRSSLADDDTSDYVIDKMNYINNNNINNDAIMINAKGALMLHGAGDMGERNYATDYEEYYYHGDGSSDMNENDNENNNNTREHQKIIPIVVDQHHYDENGDSGCNKENHYHSVNDSSHNNHIINSKIGTPSTKFLTDAQLDHRKTNKSNTNSNNDYVKESKQYNCNNNNKIYNNNNDINTRSNNHNQPREELESLHAKHPIYDHANPSNSSPTKSYQQQQLSRVQMNGGLSNHHAILNHHHHQPDPADDIDNVNVDTYKNQRCGTNNNPAERGDELQQKLVYHNNNIISSNTSDHLVAKHKKINNLNNTNNNQYIITANDYHNHKATEKHQEMQRQNMNSSMGHEQQKTSKSVSANTNKYSEPYQYPYPSHQQSPMYTQNQGYNTYGANQYTANIHNNNSGKQQQFISENHLNYPPYQKSNQQQQQKPTNYVMMSPSNIHYNLNDQRQYQQHHNQMLSNRYYQNTYQPYKTSNNTQISSLDHQMNTAPMQHYQIPMTSNYVPSYPSHHQPPSHSQMLDFHAISATNQSPSINYGQANKYSPHLNQPSNSNLLSRKFEAANNLIPSGHQTSRSYLTDDDLLYQYQAKSTHNDNLNRSVSSNQKGANSGGRLSWFGSKSSQTLDSRSYRKSSNPFASLFGGSSASKSQQDNMHQYSNTIHLGASKSNKSALNIAASQDQKKQQSYLRSAPGSLKRIKSTPLSAQQASYEAMRTIDMYLIRQIARSCMNPVLEQKIDVEIRLRELASRAMLEARDEIDALEVEKSLLTSDQRMNCYSAELERQRKLLSNGSLSTDSGRGSSKSQHRLRSATRSDVIGPAGADTSSSPALSSPQTPSKLSPVSGQSADLPSLSTVASSGATRNSKSSGGDNTNTKTSTSSNNHDTANQNQFSPISSRNCLSRVGRRNNKQREHLMQKITSSSNINCNMVMDNRASLSVSEIRIPLMWRDVDHFKGRGDYKRFAVFCLLKIDSQIYDTQLISDVDRNVTDITFDDVVCFNDIGHNFELHLEVYSCVYLEHYSFASTPRKLKEKLTSSVSRAMGRRLATQTASANFTKELEAYDKSYRFEQIASAILRLDDAGQSIKTYDLFMGPGAPNATACHKDSSSQQSFNAHKMSHLIGDYNTKNNLHQQYQSSSGSYASSTLGRAGQSKNAPPLFGHFCCKLLVRPDVFDKNIKAGYLRVAIINVPNNNTNSRSDDRQSMNIKYNTETTTTSNHRESTRSHSHESENSANPMSTDKSSLSPDSKQQLQTALVASTKMATLPRSKLRLHWALLRNFVLYLWPIEDASRDQLETVDSRSGCNSANSRAKYSNYLRSDTHSLAYTCDISSDLNTSDTGAQSRRLSSAALSKQPPKHLLNIDRRTCLLRVSNSSLTVQCDSGCFVLAAASQFEHAAAKASHRNDATGSDEASNNSAISDSILHDAANDEIGAWLRPIEQSVYDSHIWGSLLNHQLGATGDR